MSGQAERLALLSERLAVFEKRAREQSLELLKLRRYVGALEREIGKTDRGRVTLASIRYMNRISRI